MAFLLLNPLILMNNEMSIKVLGNKIYYTVLCNAEKFLSSTKLLDLSLTSSSIHIIVINWKIKTEICHCAHYVKNKIS